MSALSAVDPDITRRNIVLVVGNNFCISRRNNIVGDSGISIGAVIFHLFMCLITGGAWIVILIAWLIIKACSKK